MQNAFKAGGGASYLGFSINASTSSHEFSKKQTEMRASSKYSSATKSSQDLLETYGDRTIVEAWMRCKSTCNKPVKTWVEYLDDNNVVLKFQWSAVNPFEVRIKSAFFANATVTGQALITGKIEPGKVYAVNLHRDK